MIELSKCPNCAEEDRVTIAGKEFCMRCGTPAEDNAKMGVVEQATAEADTSTGANTPTGQDQPSNVSKFNSAPQQMQQQVQNANSSTDAMNTANGGAVSAVQSAAPMDDAQQKANLESQINNLSAQAPVANRPVANVVQTPEPQAQPPAPAAKPFVPPPEAVKKKLEQVVPTQDTAQVPAAMPTAIPDVAIAPDLSNAQPMEAKSNVKPVQGTMTLDKSTGVLSDDQFDQLRDSVAAPSVLGNMTSAEPVSEPKVNEVSDQAPVATPPVAPIKHNNDIYSAPAPQESPAASDRPVQTPAKTAKPDKKKKALKPAGIAVSIIALFMVGAYIWKLNYSNLAFKVASSKAGMSASMPGYVPAGFNLTGDIRTNPGTVSYNLVNSSANKNISISQTKTDWDSQALAENYVAPKSENYLALQAQGLTVYVLGNNQATWINKGTWYRIESSDKALTQDQIIKIATSL